MSEKKEVKDKTVQPGRIMGKVLDPEGRFVVSTNKFNIVTGHHVLLCHDGDSVGVQTVKDGKPIPPTLYTSRPMTDEEIGRTVRLALEGEPA